MRTFSDDDVAPLLQALIEFVGQKNLDKCVATWRNTLANARPIERAQAERSAFHWWPGLAQFAQWQSGTPHAPSTLLLARDAITVLDMLSTMPDSVQREFAGALGGYQSAPGHLHEVSMAHHLKQIGCQIQWCEQTGQGIPEFVAASDSVAFDVECKRISVDSGRQVARDAFARFGDVILNCLRQRAVMGRAHIHLARRLPHPTQLAQIAAALGAAVDANQLAGRIALAPWGHAELELQPADDTLVDWGKVQAEGKARRTHGQHALVHATRTPGGPTNVVQVTAESMQRDAYLQTIYKTMKPAARQQLSGARPGLLCIHIPEVRDFASLYDASGLRNMTAYFFSKPEHAHVFAVIYTSDAHVIQEPSGVRFSNQAMAFKNALCGFPEALQFRLLPQEEMASPAQPAASEAGMPGTST